MKKSSLIEESKMTEINYNSKISEVEALCEHDATACGWTKEWLSQIIELPMREACLYLFDLNIKTTASTANRQNLIFGAGGIGVDYDSLSSTNKAIADKLAEQDPVHYQISESGLNIRVPINSPDETVQKIHDRAMGLVKPFKKQNLTWARTMTLEQICGGPVKPKIREKFIQQTEQGGSYFDREKNVFYPSKELYLKSQEVIEDPSYENPERLHLDYTMEDLSLPKIVIMPEDFE